MARKTARNSPQEDPSPPSPVVEGLTWGSMAHVRSMEWYWPGAIPAGSIVLLEGRKGTGKSTLAAAIAAAVTGGPPLPGWTGPTNGRVVWESAEDSWGAVVIPRLLAAKAHIGAVARLNSIETGPQHRRLRLPNDIIYLEDILREGQVRLLILDPFVSLASQTIDVRVEQQARAYLDPLAETCERIGCTALLMRNLRKTTGGDAREQGLGSVAVTNSARSLIRCDEHPDEVGRFCVSVVVTNYARPRPTEVYSLDTDQSTMPSVVWHGQSALSSEQLAAGQGNEADRDEYSEACKHLCQVIGQQFVAYCDISRSAGSGGITERMLRRAKARLRVPSRQVWTGNSNYWEWGPPVSGWPSGLLEAVKTPPHTLAPPRTQAQRGAPPATTVPSTDANGSIEGGGTSVPGCERAPGEEG